MGLTPNGKNILNFDFDYIGTLPQVTHQNNHYFGGCSRVLDSLIIVAVARHWHCCVPNNLAGSKVNVTESWDCVVRTDSYVNAFWLLDELWDSGDAAI